MVTTLSSRRCRRLFGHCCRLLSLSSLLLLWSPLLLLLSKPTMALQSLNKLNNNNNNNPLFSFDPTKLKLNLLLENPFAKNKPFGNPQLEQQLLAAVLARNNKQQQNDDEPTTIIIEELIGQLEQTRSIPEPAIAPQIYGRWRLQYTTTQATSSPIQRTATTRSNLAIFQDIVVVDNNDDDDDNNKDRRLLVKQIIQFSDQNYLTVDALASTQAYPLPELTSLPTTPRQSTGKVLGLNLLGVSKVGAEAAEDPNRPNARINFVFDEGYFDFNNGAVRIPYPVPFRLPVFRDWVKGWIDITYLSATMRIVRGNKGSTFVLVKEPDDGEQQQQQQ
jgi:PAP_fibrillin